MPSTGAALVSSCLPCGDGLRSGVGASSCSGCPVGTLLDAASGECRSLSEDSESECSISGMACLPGVPEPVVAPEMVRGLVAELPLPLVGAVDVNDLFGLEAGSDGDGNGSEGDGAGDVQRRQLHRANDMGRRRRASSSTHQAIGDSLSKILRYSHRAATAAADAGQGTVHRVGLACDASGDCDPVSDGRGTEHAPGYNRRLQSTGSGSSIGGEDDEESSSAIPNNGYSVDGMDGNRRIVADLELGAWITSSAIISALLLLLLVPAIRPPLHCCLKQIDSMSTDHQPEQFSAVRRISTSTGGWCTVAAMLAAVAASSSLLLAYAYLNGISTAGLQVAATGVEGADRAASAASDMVLDLVLQPASFVTCEEALVLRATSGSEQVSSSDNSRSQAINTPSVVQFAATATMRDFRPSEYPEQRLCWMRAVCQDCGLPAVAMIEAEGHWSA